MKLVILKYKTFHNFGDFWGCVRRDADAPFFFMKVVTPIYKHYAGYSQEYTNFVIN